MNNKFPSNLIIIHAIYTFAYNLIIIYVIYTFAYQFEQSSCPINLMSDGSICAYT
jgi:hypothetical protein